MRPPVDPEDIEALPLFHRATIPEDYLDEMGHMNVRWYVFLFTEAVGKLFDSVGMTMEHFKKGNTGTFALTQHIRYLAEVRVGQTVAIRSRILGRTEKRLHPIHFMVNETTGALAATLETLISYADLTSRRTAPFPADIARHIDAVAAEHWKLSWEAPTCGVIVP